MASSITRTEWYEQARARAAGNPVRAAVLEDSIAWESEREGPPAPEVLPACPAWCERAEQNHDYSDRHDDGAFLRHHEWAAGEEVDAWIAQPEYNRDGVVSYGPTLISVGPTNENVDSAFARRCAARWTALADKLDEINGQAQR